MAYKHLSPKERHYIEIQWKKRVSMNDIAEALKRSQSTISRELARNTGQRGYRHKQAHEMAKERHRTKPKAIKLSDEIICRIEAGIREQWSPEQVVGRLEKDGIIKLHHETVYQYVQADKVKGGNLFTHLRHQNKTYRKCYGSTNNRTGIPNRVGIENRSEIANQRGRIGDWEGDTIIGK